MGSNKAEERRQREIRDMELNQANQAFQRADRDDAERQRLMKPAIDYNMALSTGDAETLTRTLAPMYNSLERERKAAREMAYDSIPAGASRDLVLSEIDRSSLSRGSEARFSLINDSYDKLANIGSGLGSFSLNQFGGGLRASESASYTNKSIMDAQNQKKASTLGFLGGLAGVAGGMIPTGKKGVN